MATFRKLSKPQMNIVTPPQNPSGVIQWSMDFRRFMILGDRVKAGSDNLMSGPDVTDQPGIDSYREELKEKRTGLIPGEAGPDIAEHSKFYVNRINNDPKKGYHSFQDYVAIVDLDFGGYDKGVDVIKLNFIPKELNYNCESAFAAIKPIGRNNPNYHYTGAEDKLEFEIDWHSFDMSRRDVALACRRIESLSKADAYNNPPHRVMLKWGSENILFSDHVFVVLAAPYKFTQFNKAQINQQGELESTYMLPIQAYQKVILGRITRDNLSSADIELLNYKAISRKTIPNELNF